MSDGSEMSKSQQDPTATLKGANCLKCNKVVDQLNYLTCNACKLPCHLTCSQISLETYEKNKGKYKSNFVCGTCKVKVNPNKRKNSFNDDPPLQDLLAAAVEQANQKVMEKLEQIETKNTSTAEETRSALAMVNEKLDSTNAKLVSMDQEINKLKENEAVNQRRFEHQEYLISTLQERVNMLEQYSREKNVILSGAVEKLEINEANIYNIIDGIARAMNVSIEKQDIVAAHPLRNRKGTNSIIIVFRNKEVKRMFMKNKNSAALMFQNATHKVYINHQLSEYYSNLLYQTKKTAKDANAQFVWYDNCKCLVREREGAPIFIIKKLEDLIYLKQKIQDRREAQQATIQEAQTNRSNQGEQVQLTVQQNPPTTVQQNPPANQRAPGLHA